MYTVVVRNLPWLVKARNLQKYFSRYGQIRIIVIKKIKARGRSKNSREKSASKNSRGKSAIAFVTFRFLEDAHWALTINNSELFSWYKGEYDGFTETSRLGVQFSRRTKERINMLSMNNRCLAFSGERDLGPRYQVKPFDISLFREPFEHIMFESHESDAPLYRGFPLTKSLPGLPLYPAGNFPHHIRHVIWANVCDNGEDHPYWQESEFRLLCILNNGMYAFYVAFCRGLTRFDYGVMALYLSHDPSSLVLHAMNDYDYRIYDLATAPAPCWCTFNSQTAARRLAWAMLDHKRLGQDLGSLISRDILTRIGQAIFAEEDEKMQRQLKQVTDDFEIRKIYD